MHPIETELPLTETSYFILLSLSPGPRHGYAIMKHVSTLSQGRVELSTGTLYGAIKRMLDQGWIVKTENGSSHSGRIRKAYQLSDAGRSLLKAEVQRLEGLVLAAHLTAEASSHA
jgi:DNA-binding PadR family transcriptional regulator